MTRVVVFDVLGTLFDLGRLRGRLADVGAPGTALEAWFGQLLHSATSLTLAGEFRPFAEIAERSLAALFARLELDPSDVSRAIGAMAELEPYPDAREAFETLEGRVIGVAVLTNGGAAQTVKLLERAGLAGQVRLVVSVEEVEAYKPAPAPYRHAAARLDVGPAELTLIAAHAWDVVGARAAGLGAVWVERLERRWPLPVAVSPSAPDLRQAAEPVLAGR